MPRKSKRRKVRTFFRRWKDLSFRHTWVNPLILLLILLSAYAINPSPTNPLHNAIFLSYKLSPSDPLIPLSIRLNSSAPAHYGKGRADFAFVAFYIIVLSFSREFLMQRLIRPMALYCGIRSRAKQNRFMEQAYTAIYFGIFGPLGLFVMSRTPVWYFNTDAMFAGFPHRTHEGIFKAYYLLQASYWAQQAIVLCLQLEKPRKDFKELVGHHIVTLALIWLSYRFHFTYMGLAVYITHDISDFFLAVSIFSLYLSHPISKPETNSQTLQTSKTLNYLSSPIVVPYFTLFILIWIYLRHYINLMILYAVLTTFRTIGPFQLDWAGQQYKCSLSQWITFSLLAALQGINLFWLYFIIKIALNVVFADIVQDMRSEDEEEEDADDRKGEVKMANGHLKNPSDIKSVRENAEAKKEL